MHALLTAGQIPRLKSAEILAQLGDRTLTGFQFPRRFSDCAAGALIRMLGLEKDFSVHTGDVEEIDRTIEKLTAWWAKHKDEVDWAALRRKAEEARSPRK